MTDIERKKLIAEIRKAVANYMYSEGCGCCESPNHDEHKAALGKLLKVKKYKDRSGYDFNNYKDKQHG